MKKRNFLKSYKLMRIYSAEELKECQPEAFKKLMEDYRDSTYFPRTEEYLNCLHAFIKEVNNLGCYSEAYYEGVYPFRILNIEDCINWYSCDLYCDMIALEEMNGLRLYKFVVNNMLHILEPDFELTGFEADWAVRQPLQEYLDFVKNNKRFPYDTLYDLIESMINAILVDCQKDKEYWLTDEEGFIEDCNANNRRFVIMNGKVKEL